MLKMLVNHTPLNNFSALPTLSSSKLDYTLKNASNGTIAQSQRKLGPSSKPNSTMPNAFFATNSAPQNNQASIAAMPITHPPPKPNPPSEYHEALINLASSAAANRELLTTLANSMATINQHINQLNKPNPSTCNKPDDIDTATDSTALSSLTTSITNI